MKSQEWTIQKQFNPFNSFKLLAHIERWTSIQKGILHPPVLVTIDPINTCNFRCIWCNSKQVISKRKRYLSKSALKNIVKILHNWRSPEQNYRVKAACIAGGGKPLLNDYTGFLIDNLVKSGIDVGIVTNGSFINKNIRSLAKCHWVSVSVDSGTSSTFSKLKNTHPSQFDKVIKNIQSLISYSNKHNTFLSSSPLSFGVIYKFLLHKDNISEIKIAAKIAKSIGCRGIHIRPVGTPWYEMNKTKSIFFSNGQIEEFHQNIESARQLEDENFSVYGITHKFTDNFKPRNVFSKCHALFMTTVFMPPYGDDGSDSFVLSQCCDRRGDLTVELGRNITSLEGVLDKWGSDYHWKMQDKINLTQCPRCTYAPHNEIYENAILKDNMSINFI